jgi:hypothetical protein
MVSTMAGALREVVDESAENKFEDQEGCNDCLLSDEVLRWCSGCSGWRLPLSPAISQCGGEFASVVSGSTWPGPSSLSLSHATP